MFVPPISFSKSTMHAAFSVQYVFLEVWDGAPRLLASQDGAVPHREKRAFSVLKSLTAFECTNRRISSRCERDALQIGTFSLIQRKAYPLEVAPCQTLPNARLVLDKTHPFRRKLNHHCSRTACVLNETRTNSVNGNE